MTNICTRCGGQRKASKSWDEVVVLYGRTTTITHTEHICLDPTCQKIVDDQLSAQKEKRVLLEQQKELEKQARARRLASAK